MAASPPDMVVGGVSSIVIVGSGTQAGGSAAGPPKANHPKRAMGVPRVPLAGQTGAASATTQTIDSAAVGTQNNTAQAMVIALLLIMGIDHCLVCLVEKGSKSRSGGGGGLDRLRLNQSL
jgi:hypothetical protein